MSEPIAPVATWERQRSFRILIFSQYFWPEPVPKLLELATGLRALGASVEVVTGFPNYPAGKIYPEYRLRFTQREVVEGIPVRRMVLYPDHGRGFVGRILNYGSFMLSGLIGGLMASRFDVMYVFHPPPLMGLAAAVIRLVRGGAFVYDVQDIWPDSAIASGFLRPGRVTTWMAALERWAYRCADHILVVSSRARENLVDKGIAPDKITVAPHWYDDSTWQAPDPSARDAFRASAGWEGRFVVMFAGNLGMMQGLDTVLRACVDVGPQTLMVFVGDGIEKPRLQQMAAELGVADRVIFVPRQPPSAIGTYFAAADALLVHLRASPAAELAIPTKTIAYLAAGKPIVMANAGASADLVREAKAGIVVAPDDAPGLARAVAQLAATGPSERETLGRNGRQFYEQHFTREATLPIYRDVLARFARRERA